MRGTADQPVRAIATVVATIHTASAAARAVKSKSRPEWFGRGVASTGLSAPRPTGSASGTVRMRFWLIRFEGSMVTEDRRSQETEARSQNEVGCAGFF